jgi:hypothetical protein
MPDKFAKGRRSKRARGAIGRELVKAASQPIGCRVLVDRVDGATEDDVDEVLVDCVPGATEKDVDTLLKRGDLQRTSQWPNLIKRLGYEASPVEVIRHEKVFPEAR